MSETVIYQQINKDHAYWSEKRLVGQTVGGHTAGLLTHRKDGNVTTNVVFDTGIGTIDGLCDLSNFSWQLPLEVFITHAHIDHHAELMLISEHWCHRESKTLRPPLAVHCTEETASMIQPVHRFRFFEGQTLHHVPVVSERPFQLGIFSITPLSVDHFPGAVIYVVEFSDHKIIIGWDMKTLPDPKKYPLLRRASLALIEATTWAVSSQETNHTCVRELVDNGSFRFMDSLDVLTPDSNHCHYGIHLVHYGGSEDIGGLMSDEQFISKLYKEFPQYRQLVGMARRGSTWAFNI